MRNPITHHNKLRFLLISSDKFPPTRVDVSVLFGKELSAKGHVLHWILQSDEDCSHAYHTEWEGGDVWVGATNNGTKLHNRILKHIYNLVNDLKMLRLIHQNKYDIIQVKDKFISALVAILAARINGANLTYWLSYPFPEASLHRYKEGTARYPLLYFIRGIIFKFILYRIIIPQSKHVFVQSEQMKQDIVNMGIPENKLTPVPMGVSLDMFPNNTHSTIKPDSSSPNSLVYLGTLLKVRKIDFLIRVIAKVIKEVPDTVLYLIGSGDDPTDEQILKDEADRLGIRDAIIFTGKLPQKEALDLVKKANVCLSPFYPTPILNSTSPTKLIEYMALSKPVIANDHPEQKLVIEESGGGICVPYDEDEFCEAILTLLRNPNKAMKMGKKARQYVENKRSYKVIADNVEKQYARICSHS